MICEICEKEIENSILMRGRIDETGDIYNREYYHVQCFVKDMIKRTKLHKNAEVQK